MNRSFVAKVTSAFFLLPLIAFFFYACNKDEVDNVTPPLTTGLRGDLSQLGSPGNTFDIIFLQDPVGLEDLDIKVMSSTPTQSNVRFSATLHNPFLMELAEIYVDRFPDFASIQNNEFEVNAGLKFTEDGIALMGPGVRSSDSEEQVLVKYDAEVGQTFSSSHGDKTQTQRVTHKWMEDGVRHITMETIEHNVPGMESLHTNYSEAQGLISGIAVFVNGEIIEFGVLPKYPNGPLLTDGRDGNTYRTVKIGNQVWMAENMKFLPQVSEPMNDSREVPYHYVYGYVGEDVQEAKETNNYKSYGVLYNWPAAKQACPPGWHLPSDAEWTALTDYLGGEEVAGGKLKEAGIDHWSFFNLNNASNESGFTALPGGQRNWDGQFQAIGGVAYFWTASEYNQNHAWRRGMNSMSEAVNRTDNGKHYGMSVRCIKN